MHLDDLKFNGANVKATPRAVGDSGTSLRHGREVIAAAFCLTAVLSSPEYTVDCSATYNVVDSIVMPTMTSPKRIL